MKIVHVCLSNFYIDNFGYQENIIPKYNKKDGHDVSIIASTFNYNKENGHSEMTKPGEYINEDGIKVTRINYKYKKLGKLNSKLKIYQGTYKILEKEQPDIIFNHGLQFIDLLEVIKYVKKNPNCKLMADSHAAYINSGTNFLSREILHKIVYKNIIKIALPYMDKVFMIAPGCKKFAEDMYNVPSNKMEYLYLGADTEAIDFQNKEKIKQEIRGELDIEKDDFVYITGGKLSEGKNVELLLNSFKNIQEKKVKLIIFGVFSEDIKEKMLRLIQEDSRVKYIGWLNGERVYDYYLAADAAIFPGTKSALWEQSICCGLPIICKRWEGMEYVDVGGNCIFLDHDNINYLTENMEKLIVDKSLYNRMREIAESKAYGRFSYKLIARQAIKVEKKV